MRIKTFSRRNSVRLAIRKIQFALNKKGPQPTADAQKLFLMSDKPLNLEASLDKDVSLKHTVLYLCFLMRDVFNCKGWLFAAAVFCFCVFFLKWLNFVSTGLLQLAYKVLL